MSPIGPSLPPLGPIASPRVGDALDGQGPNAFDFTFAGYAEGAGSISVRSKVGGAAIEKLAADVLDRLLVR